MCVGLGVGSTDEIYFRVQTLGVIGSLVIRIIKFESLNDFSVIYVYT